ncbi:MAG: aminotransferase class I/II-fold pyridoxal phosphate-dependent enzyme [Elusimicrobia bacterium]|nr:aminotransferase class I/II-fold pyridoxal phosphate-dependent enzyme [Elusimicrobiota bacterium]
MTRRPAPPASTAPRPANSHPEGGRGARPPASTAAWPPLNPGLERLPPYLFVALDRKRAEAQASGRDVINLGIGDPDTPTPEFIVSEMSRAVRDPRTHRYPDGRGSVEFREAVADFMSRKYGVKLDPAREIVALIGSKEGIGHLPLALAGRGSTVCVPDPGYPVYAASAILAGAKPVAYPLREDNGFLPDFTARPLSGPAKRGLIFMNYPNNPTGATAPKNLFEEAVRWAGRRGAWLAHDAAYAEAFFGGVRPASLLAAAGAMERGVEFHSLSKTFSMAGWRVGWAAGNRRAVAALAQVKSNLDSGVFTAVQHAAAVALRKGDSAADAMRKLVSKRRSRCIPLLVDAGWEVFESSATFYLWCRTPGDMPSAVCSERLLDQAGVLATPGSGFGRRGEGWIRFALTVGEERLVEAMTRVARIRW